MERGAWGKVLCVAVDLHLALYKIGDEHREGGEDYRGEFQDRHCDVCGPSMIDSYEFERVCKLKEMRSAGK